MPKTLKSLEKVIAEMSGEGHKALLDYASFLAERYPAPTVLFTDPVPIPRGENESVVAGMKRLSETYPMIDKAQILHHASSLMGQHIMHGREANEVIDDLERLFEKQYEKERKELLEKH